MARLRRLLSRRRARDEERAFVAEGEKLLAEAMSVGAALDTVYVAAGHVSEVVEQAAAASVPVVELAPGVVERVADAVTPQPVLTVAQHLDLDLEALELGTENPLVVVLAAVGDPGNAGTVLRTAEAAGAGAVLFCDGSVDVYNPKTVRASAGSVFHVQIVRGGSPVEVLERLRLRGLRCLGTAARNGPSHDETDLAGPVALVLGSEAHGLPSDLENVLDGMVSIPIAGRAESLNVGMAAAVLCFEAARQRRAG